MVWLFILHIPSLLCNSSFAQQWNLSECITRALESNFAIKITRNTAEMAKNEANVGVFLPTLNATARQNQTRNDTKTENSIGETVSASGVKNDTYSAGVELRWRLFDGMDMFVTYERHQELEAMGELAMRQEVENLMVRVCSLYYNVVLQHYRLETAAYTLELSAERFEDAQFRYRIGKNSGLEAKQAIVDLHADSSAYVRQVEQLKNAYISLNRVINVELGLDSYVSDTLLMGEFLNRSTLEQHVLADNTLLLMAQKEQYISLLNLKKARAILFPTLDFTSGYNYNRSETPSSQTVMNQANGLYWGFSVNLPLFNRMQHRVQVKNARLKAENAELSYMDMEKEILGDLALLYNTYENNLLMVNFERENAIIAETNVNEALRMFKLGTLSGIEFREFQRSYTNAVDRKFSAMYLAKISELSLQLISGNVLGNHELVMSEGRQWSL